MKRKFQPAAWVVWLVSAAVLTMVSRNPFYLLIILLIARIVQISCKNIDSQLTFPFWRLAGIILIFSILFNVLLVHIGQTILITIPAYIWLIGGSLTLEAAVYGAINGLVLITLLAVFMVFNAVVPISDLVRLMPKSMTNIGLILLIAMTYVPETRNHLRRIREAQALRGHRLHGIQDWRPIVIPLLIGGMERAVNLAETMISRGYGSATDIRSSPHIQTGMLAGLLLVFTGSLLIFWAEIAGWLTLGGGILVILGLMLWSGRRIKTTRYRERPWTWPDRLIVIFSFVPLILIFMPLSIIDSTALFYTPYPSLTLPDFNIWIGLALTLLAAPAVVIEL